MNFKNVKGPSVPSAVGTLVKVALIGGTAVYAALNSLYNVDGGHRAVVFNRIVGIKDKVLTPDRRYRNFLLCDYYANFDGLIAQNAHFVSFHLYAFVDVDVGLLNQRLYLLRFSW